jgi:hypothetical protein
MQLIKQHIIDRYDPCYNAIDAAAFSGDIIPSWAPT